jgi:hypothetical protein
MGPTVRPLRDTPLITSEPTTVQLIPLCHVHPDTGENLFHLPVLSKIVYKFSIRIHKVHDNCVVNLPSNKTFNFLLLETESFISLY